MTQSFYMVTKNNIIKDILNMSYKHTYQGYKIEIKLLIKLVQHKLTLYKKA